jgi:hypothetical protein
MRARTTHTPNLNKVRRHGKDEDAALVPKPPAVRVASENIGHTRDGMIDPNWEQAPAITFMHKRHFWFVNETSQQSSIHMSHLQP